MDRTDRFMLLAFVLLAASFAAHGAREENFNGLSTAGGDKGSEGQ